MEVRKNMKQTGVFITAEQYDSVLKLLEPTMTMNLGTGMNTVTPGDRKAAWKLLDDIAIVLGLPNLSNDGHYGLLRTKELVSFS